MIGTMMEMQTIIVPALNALVTVLGVIVSVQNSGRFRIHKPRTRGLVRSFCRGVLMAVGIRIVRVRA
jgi:hypothetical protein